MKINKHVFNFVLTFLFVSTFLLNKVNAQAFSLDTTFNINFNFYSIGSSANVYDLNYEPDGKLLIYGEFEDDNMNSDILRIYDNGSLDNIWQQPSCISGGGISFAARLNNQYLIRSLSSLTKVSYDGQIIDTTWSLNLMKDDTCGNFEKPYVLLDGSILVGTHTCNCPNNKTRFFKKFLPNGRMDTNFRHNTNNVIFGITKYSPDKLLIFGGGNESTYFTKYDSINIKLMCRIDTSGNLDTTFKSIITGGLPFHVYIQNNGKIIVVGLFNILNQSNFVSMVRLNIDGSLDSTFNNYHNVDCNSYYNTINTICPTTDNGYIIGGYFNKYQKSLRNNICKTDINGFIDTNYFKGLGIDSSFYQHSFGDFPYLNNIKQGTNDTYYVMGYFTYYNGVHVNPIIRIKGLSAGINEIKQEKWEIKVYPNPAKNQTTITYPILITEGELQVYNTLGHLIFEEKLAKASSQKEINIQSFKAGLYKVIVKEKGIIKGQVSLVIQ